MTTTQSTTERAAVTVVGLGPMGLALAEALLAQGHPLTVWNRTAAKADALVAKGAHRAASVADAVLASPLTITCLNDYDTMYQVFAGAEEALRGRALINLNSGTPTEAHAADEWATRTGFDYLDGAIMVPPPLVGTPGAVFLYSGPEGVFTTHRPTLASLGDPRFLGADPGRAVLYNTALLDLMYTSINGFLHAAALVGSAGVPAATFADLAVNWFLPTVVDATLLAQAEELDRSNYPGDLGSLEMNRTALEHITRTSVEQGVHVDLPRLAQQIAEQAIAEGHGDKNYFAVFEVLKKARAGA